MQFKEEKMIQDWDIIDPRLKQFLRMVDAFSILCFDKEIMITSLYRPDDKDSMHSKGKAADIRTKWYDGRELGILEVFVLKLRDRHLSEIGFAVEPHEELKGKPQQHLHLAVK